MAFFCSRRFHHSNNLRYKTGAHWTTSSPSLHLLQPRSWAGTGPGSGMLLEHPLAWQPPSPKAQGRVWPSGRGLPPHWGAKRHPLPCSQGTRLCPGLSPCPFIPSQALLGFGGPQVPPCALGPGSACSAGAGRTPHRCSGATQLGPRPLGPKVQCHAALILVPCGKGARGAGAGTVMPAPGVMSSHCVPKASRAGPGPWLRGEPSPIGAAEDAPGLLLPLPPAGLLIPVLLPAVPPPDRGERNPWAPSPRTPFRERKPRGCSIHLVLLLAPLCAWFLGTPRHPARRASPPRPCLALLPLAGSRHHRCPWCSLARRASPRRPVASRPRRPRPLVLTSPSVPRPPPPRTGLSPPHAGLDARAFSFCLLLCCRRRLRTRCK